MELAGMVGGGRVRYLLMTGFLVWVLFTFVDLYAANFRDIIYKLQNF